MKGKIDLSDTYVSLTTGQVLKYAPMCTQSGHILLWLLNVCHCGITSIAKPQDFKFVFLDRNWRRRRQDRKRQFVGKQFKIVISLHFEICFETSVKELRFNQLFAERTNLCPNQIWRKECEWNGVWWLGLWVSSVQCVFFIRSRYSSSEKYPQYQI